MKRIIALLMAMLLISLMIPVALGEANEDAKESNVETIMLKKGAAIIKEFIDCGKVKIADYSAVYFQTAVITDVETNTKYDGIRIRFDYWNGKYDNGQAVALIDSEEIDSIVSTLEYIKEHKSGFVNYTEVAYTASGGFSIGAYKNASETGIFFKADGHQAVANITELDNVINAFKLAQSKIPH